MTKYTIRNRNEKTIIEVCCGLRSKPVFSKKDAISKLFCTIKPYWQIRHQKDGRVYIDDKKYLDK